MDWKKAIATLTDVAESLPGWIDAGIDVYDLYHGARKAAAQIGTKIGKSNEELAALDALIKSFDDNLDAVVAKRREA